MLHMFHGMEMYKNILEYVQISQLIMIYLKKYSF